MEEPISYQNVHVRSPPMEKESDMSHDTVTWRRAARWRVLALGVVTTALIVLVTSSAPLDLLYSNVARLGYQDPNNHPHEHHDSEHSNNHHHEHHDSEFVNKIVVINKIYHDTGQQRKKKKSKQNEKYKEKKEKIDMSFMQQAGEIGGYVDVNKTCAEAYSTPAFRDFGKLFRHLMGSHATRLDNHTWSFDLCGYSSVQWVCYNNTSMTLEVVIVQGFQVFQSFREVFAFQDRSKHPRTCRIHRKQYIILVDSGPVSWDDMEAQGNAELEAIYDLFRP